MFSLNFDGNWLVAFSTACLFVCFCIPLGKVLVSFFPPFCFAFCFLPWHLPEWVFGPGGGRRLQIWIPAESVTPWPSAFWLSLSYHRNPPFFFLCLTHIPLNSDLAITLLMLLIKSDVRKSPFPADSSCCRSRPRSSCLICQWMWKQ